MKCAPRCRSIRSSSAGATRVSKTSGRRREIPTASRFARRRFWTSSSSRGLGASAPLRRLVAKRPEFLWAPASPEMGTAVGTAVANRVASYLGGVADEVALAQIDAFGALALVTTADPFEIDQKTQDAEARNPRWVPEISSAAAASIGAHVGTHAAAEAAHVIFRFGLSPAALDLWRIAPNDPRAAQWQAARWSDGQLTVPGLSPLALADVAARAHAKDGVTGAMTHGFNRWAWSQADFKID